MIAITGTNKPESICKISFIELSMVNKYYIKNFKTLIILIKMY